MPLYQYTAMDSTGKEQKGRKEAASEEEVATFLKNQGLFPTSIKSATQGGKGGGKDGKGGGGGGFNMNINLGPMVIKTKDLTIVTRQMAILLEAGLPLIRSLKTLSRQSKNPAIKKILDETASSVEGGATFSEALAQHPKSFDKLYLNMIRAGEAAGKLELILDRLAMFMEKAAKIQGKVKSAMVYPIIVLCVAGIICAMSEHYLIMVGGIFGLVILIKIVLKIPFLRFYIDWVKYNMPLFGPIVSKSAISKFGRTLGTLMGSGVPVLNSLTIVKETSGNEVVATAVVKVYEAVKEGEGMASPLQATRIFPEMVISMIEVGEETGKLPEMLDKIADTYDEEVDNAVGALTSMIEPIMMVGLAVIVGEISIKR